MYFWAFLGNYNFLKTDIVSISNRTEGATRDNQLNQISFSRFLFRVKRRKSTLARSNGGGRVRAPGPFTFFFLKCNFFWGEINFQANKPFHFYLNFSLLKPMLYVLARYPCYYCQFITGETISRAILRFLGITCIIWIVVGYVHSCGLLTETDEQFSSSTFYETRL